MRPWEANVRRVVPYVPGDQPRGNKLVKPNTSENPYPLVLGAERAIREMDMDRLRRYPDPAVSDLVGVLAEYHGVGTDQVSVGAGSDGVIAMFLLTFFNSPKPVLFPDITHSLYKVWVDLYRIPYETPKLGGDFSIIPRNYKRESGEATFPNPDTPADVYTSLSQMGDIIEASQDAVVIVDEAYIDLTGLPTLRLIGTCDNLLVVQTFNKPRSMIGLQIGFAVGNLALIRALSDVKYSYDSHTMDLPSIVMGVGPVKGREYLEDITGKITATRERVRIHLRELGFTFPNSEANFIFASHKSMSVTQILEALKGEQIYVRYFDGERLNNSLHISTGMDERMETLFALSKRFLREQ